MSKIRSVGFCIAVASAVTTMALVTVAGMTPFVRFMWIGFLPMIVYFACGTHRVGATYAKVGGSFVCGMVWGQISNLLYHSLPQNIPLAGTLDCLGIIFLMCFIHICFFGGTAFGFIPGIFLGFAETVGLWGRPFPFAGMGMLGSDFTWIQGLGIQLFYLAFGLGFAIIVELLTDFMVPRILPKPVGDSLKTEKA